jgi:hypothetical protein
VSHTKPGTSSSTFLFKVIEPINCKKVSIHWNYFRLQKTGLATAGMSFKKLCDASQDSGTIHHRNQPHICPAVGSSSSKFQLKAHPIRMGNDIVAGICISANAASILNPTLFTCDQDFQLQYKTACPPCPDFVQIFVFHHKTQTVSPMRVKIVFP